MEMELHPLKIGQFLECWDNNNLYIGEVDSISYEENQNTYGAVVKGYSKNKHAVFFNHSTERFELS